MIKARAAVENLREYHPPLGRRDGLRLDFNENTLGCSPRVVQRLRTITAEQLSCYPERLPVERIIAEFLRLRPEEVLLTNGVDEAIHLICETFVEPSDEVIIVVPTYAMYEIYAGATGARVTKIPAADDFAFPLSRVLAAASAATRVVLVANPNNPTGTTVSATELMQLASALPNTILLVDEAYFDFFGETMLRAIDTLPNLLVSRTFSKAYGMAGLRAGVLAGNAELLKMVRRVASPYNVNAAALACLPEAVQDAEYLNGYVRQVLRGRDRLQSELLNLGIHFWPSSANFVLMHLGPRREIFVQEMRAAGVLVRDRNSDPGCSGCVRITLGTDEHNERLLQSLRTIAAHAFPAESAE